MTDASDALPTDPLARRTAITAKIAAATGIDEAMIEDVVAAFYARVQKDALIGPIFAERIQDWTPHLQRMCDFWSSVALMTGRYHGQPMRVHLPLPLEAEHFARWLSLFEETLRERCPPPAVEHFMERARRIAESLQLGIATQRGTLFAQS